MTQIIFREATIDDVFALAAIRGDTAVSKEYWQERISGYMNGTHHPQQALRPRIVYVACIDESIIGFVAGHLTERYNCDGELQWINVIENFTRKGIASQLIQLLATWFIKLSAYKICIDPASDDARQFYKMTGATDLNAHWMFWPDIRSIITSRKVGDHE
jgi:GNAT superfamily N-acetyltransferase